jgi:hypothetical protein
VIDLLSFSKKDVRLNLCIPPPPLPPPHLRKHLFCPSPHTPHQTKHPPKGATPVASLSLSSSITQANKNAVFKQQTKNAI